MGSPPRRYQSSTLAASSPARSRRSTAGVESVFPSVLRELASITWVPVCPATVAVTLNTRRGTYGGSTSPWEATGNPAVKRYTSCASSNDPSTASAICQVPPIKPESYPDDAADRHVVLGSLGIAVWKRDDRRIPDVRYPGLVRGIRTVCRERRLRGDVQGVQHAVKITVRPSNLAPGARADAQGVSVHDARGTVAVRAVQVSGILDGIGVVLIRGVEDVARLVGGDNAEVVRGVVSPGAVPGHRQPRPPVVAVGVLVVGEPPEVDGGVAVRDEDGIPPVRAQALAQVVGEPQGLRPRVRIRVPEVRQNPVNPDPIVAQRVLDGFPRRRRSDVEFVGEREAGLPLLRRPPRQPRIDPVQRLVYLGIGPIVGGSLALHQEDRHGHAPRHELARVVVARTRAQRARDRGPVEREDETPLPRGGSRLLTRGRGLGRS